MLGHLVIHGASLVLALPFARALDLYVAPGGSDSSDGSVGSPFQSLAQAQTALRNATSRAADEDNIVHVADGFYTLDEPLNLTSADSGTNTSPVTWRAEGTNVVISGGLKVSNWQLNETSGIYSARIPPGTESRNLYINGQAANYARSTLQRKDFDFDNETYT